jgi:hypothetical protein
MESGPPKIAEIIVGCLLPPACREETLGDMRERYRSAWSYFVEALQVVPLMIYSRIRRTTDAVVALMEVASMYTAFVVVAKWVNPTLIVADDGLARLAIPPAVVLAVMILADAYSKPGNRWLLKPLLVPILGFAVAYVEQTMYRQWSLPALVFAMGSGTALPLVFALRLVFPPVTDRPQTAKVPAFWQKLEMAPLSISPRGALVLLAVILYLLGKNHIGHK